MKILRQSSSRWFLLAVSAALAQQLALEEKDSVGELIEQPPPCGQPIPQPMQAYVPQQPVQVVQQPVQTYIPQQPVQVVQQPQPVQVVAPQQPVQVVAPQQPVQVVAPQQPIQVQVVAVAPSPTVPCTTTSTSLTQLAAQQNDLSTTPSTTTVEITSTSTSLTQIAAQRNDLSATPPPKLAPTAFNFTTTPPLEITSTSTSLTRNDLNTTPPPELAPTDFDFTTTPEPSSATPEPISTTPSPELAPTDFDFTTTTTPFVAQIPQCPHLQDPLSEEQCQEFAQTAQVSPEGGVSSIAKACRKVLKKWIGEANSAQKCFDKVNSGVCPPGSSNRYFLWAENGDYSCGCTKQSATNDCNTPGWSGEVEYYDGQATSQNDQVSPYARVGEEEDHDGQATLIQRPGRSRRPGRSGRTKIREEGCTISKAGPDSAFVDSCSAPSMELRPQICKKLYPGCIRLQTDAHGVCIYYNRGGELATDRDGMDLVCGLEIPETETMTTTTTETTSITTTTSETETETETTTWTTETSTTAPPPPCPPRTVNKRFCMVYDVHFSDVRMKACSHDPCETFVRRGATIASKCAPTNCLSVTNAPSPSVQNCHSMFFEDCNPSNVYQQWEPLSGSGGSAWKNSATGTEFSPGSKKDGKSILACKPKPGKS